MGRLCLYYPAALWDKQRASRRLIEIRANHLGFPARNGQLKEVNCDQRTRLL
jgi:hypothetical protein